jgi:3-methyladenine DNA glycosylase AlkD
MLPSLISELEQFADKERATHSQGFFKTGIGEYGEGDVFIGVTMPVQRTIAKKYLGLNLNKIQELLNSKIHEHRMTGLIILTEKYKKSNERERENIFGFYLKNTKNINNWDLVDVTCPHIIGKFLIDKDKKVLYDFANSKDLWEKRIAIVSTWWFIRNKEIEDALALSEILLNDSHDLIHKAVGWMLREVGKKDIEALKKFLKFHYKNMPRTMLRYSIEKFEEGERKKYLEGRV